MNGIIIIDKPGGWTSHDVVAKLRGILKEKRIGHGGTLDPMATGVLPIFVGRATRAAQFCENAEKRYTAAARFGISTDTQDITGSVISEKPVRFAREEMLRSMERFRGEIMQTPPMYSAVKVGGRKLYELARRGEKVERTARKITIFAFDYMKTDENGDFIFDIACSKGTYIRTLISDLGDSLGCGAVLTALRRTQAGAFTENDAVSLEYVEKCAKDGDFSAFLRETDSFFKDYPAARVSERHALKAVYNGGEYKSALENGLYRVYDMNGKFLMLGRCENGVMKTVKSFFEVM